MNAQLATRVPTHFHSLPPDQHEALALMLEECGEVNCTVGALMLEGARCATSRRELVCELGDFLASIEMAARVGLISQTGLKLARSRGLEKLEARMQHITLETPADEALDGMNDEALLDSKPFLANAGDHPRFHRLSPDEYEALAQLTISVGCVLHMIGKILRHGLTSKNPVKSSSDTNLDLLQYALGETLAAIDVLVRTGLVTVDAIKSRRREKLTYVGVYLHHIGVEGEASRSPGAQDLDTDWIYGASETQRLRVVSSPVAAIA